MKLLFDINISIKNKNKKVGRFFLLVIEVYAIFILILNNLINKLLYHTMSSIFWRRISLLRKMFEQIKKKIRK